jgi:Flp pilus assembly protein TadB
MIAVLAAFCGALTVFVAVGALTGQFSFNQRRLAARAVTLQRGGAGGETSRAAASVSVLKDDTISGNAALSAFLRRFSWFSTRAETLDRAALPLKVSEYLLLLAVTFLAVTAVVTILSKLLIGGILVGLLAVVMVELWVRSRARARLALFN